MSGMDEDVVMFNDLIEEQENPAESDDDMANSRDGNVDDDASQFSCDGVARLLARDKYDHFAAAVVDESAEEAVEEGGQNDAENGISANDDIANPPAPRDAPR